MLRHGLTRSRSRICSPPVRFPLICSPTVRFPLARSLSSSTRPRNPSHSLVAALEQEAGPSNASGAGLLVTSGVLLAAGALCYLAYDKAVRAYAFMLLGSAATEQLFMQQLEGKVELELLLTPFSSTGEICGLLSPVAEAPSTPGPLKHRAFTLIGPNDQLTKRTRERHAALGIRQQPPVAMVRRVDLLAPVSLTALVEDEPAPVSLFVRKSRGQTEFFTERPLDWGGVSLAEMR
mmetsp:Transcript_18286/g.60287  ORF Transcript_18286/g.60287 Transcript_18286/m.60287 type:complete len:235 (-) Transcript_18286:556-1260(-)